MSNINCSNFLQFDHVALQMCRENLINLCTVKLRIHTCMVRHILQLTKPASQALDTSPGKFKWRILSTCHGKIIYAVLLIASFSFCGIVFCITFFHAGHVLANLQKRQSQSDLRNSPCKGVVLVKVLGTLVDTTDSKRTINW